MSVFTELNCGELLSRVFLSQKAVSFLEMFATNGKTTIKESVSENEILIV